MGWSGNSHLFKWEMKVGYHKSCFNCSLKMLTEQKVKHFLANVLILILITFFEHCSFQW